ncbi:MAG TPA: acyl-CoA dehydrogenase family protein [Acidimicrobiia bacterium]|jgi:alkylation response protein AidB-like acyl-CoA dehydrogenase
MRTIHEGVSVSEYRERARHWLEENVPKTGAEERRRGGGRDGHSRVFAGDPELQRKQFEAGFAGITIPVEYGGQGLTPAHEAAYRREAAAYAAIPVVNMGCAGPMLMHASGEFLSRHIPKMLSGEERWVQFFSEPGAGSDLAGVRTRADRDGERWILNGAKIWSTGAAFATHGMCLARTDWDVPKHRGLTWFGVRTDLPGVTIQPIKEISGGQDFCQEFFDNVELTDDDVIGDVNEGWAVTNTMLVYERGAAPADGTGGGMAAMLAAQSGRRTLPKDLVALAKSSGRDQEPHARQLIARAHVNDYARAQLVRRVAQLIAQGANPAGTAAYGKLASGVIDPIRARIGLELGRANALLWDPGDAGAASAALAYLNGRIMSIAGGTNEIQRNGIGERALGLPREPSFDSEKPFRQVVADAEHWTGKVG